MSSTLERALTWVLFGVLFSFFGWMILFAGELSFIMAQADRSGELAADLERQRAMFLDEKEEVVLLFVGDIMLARAVGEAIEESGDYRFPFLNIAGFLRGADFVFGNLESPVSDRGAKQGSIYSFRADPRVVEGLEYAGFDVLSLANNHIWDWGAEALVDTVSLVEAAGIEVVGAGLDYEDANEEVLLDVGGDEIAVLAYTNLLPKSLEAGLKAPGLSDFDLEEVKARVADLKEQGNLVIVSMHWGEEYKSESNASQQEIGRALIDAGASLVVGHHPHVPQELERHGDGWIAYSLGNFVFDQVLSEETMKGEILKVVLRKGALVEPELIPFVILPTLQPQIQ